MEKEKISSDANGICLHTASVCGKRDFAVRTVGIHPQSGGWVFRLLNHRGILQGLIYAVLKLQNLILSDF